MSKTSFLGDVAAAADPMALIDRRELALVAVERTRMPMVVTDPRRADHPIILANQAFLDLTGYTADEVIGHNCRFLQGPETAPAAIEAIRRGMAASDHHLSVELLNYRKDGSTFWNELCISPVRDEHGALLYHFASQQDVTAKKRAVELEAVERLLLMEVDHRALNALALVNGIVRLSSADTAADYAASVVSRVGALARAHRLLAQSGWCGSDLRELIEAERPQALAERVTVEGPPVRLAPRLVQPLTLVIHELMENGVRHGALSQGQGSVHVSWFETPDHGLDLRWQESGVRVCARDLHEGVGLRLVKGLVENQLGGKTSIDWTADGIDGQVKFPLDS